MPTLPGVTGSHGKKGGFSSGSSEAAWLPEHLELAHQTSSALRVYVCCFKAPFILWFLWQPQESTNRAYFEKFTIIPLYFLLCQTMLIMCSVFFKA